MTAGQDRPLRVAINALLDFSKGGSNQRVVSGLVRELGRLTDGPEEYIIVCRKPEWLQSIIGPNQRIVVPPEEGVFTGKRGLLKRMLSRPLTLFKGNGSAMLPRWFYTLLRWPGVPISNGFYERLRCDVIHFPYPWFVLCQLPSVYNPHDLQYLHYPQFFDPQKIALWNNLYPSGCFFAETVVVSSEWVKQDVVRHYNITPTKVQVIPWATSADDYPEPTTEIILRVRKKYRLPQDFALYPAMVLEHKNHLRLLEALALVRDRHGLKINLVCTGRYGKFWKRVEERLFALRLQDQAKFLGMIPAQELRALYRLAQFVVVPSLFEASSGPVREAWLDGAPVACSNVTSLPVQVQDAALLFDPFSVETIAEAIVQMVTNPDLRKFLSERGKARLRVFDWKRTAKAYRAVYRRTARRPLTEEDRALLRWDWMQEASPPAEPTQNHV